MVHIERHGDLFVFEIKGLHKVWALKSQLKIPAEHVSNAYPNTQKLSGWDLGLRMPGTHLPGVITAGTFWANEGTIFCDVSKPNKSIVVELHDEHYKKLIIEVEDSASAIELLLGK